MNHIKSFLFKIIVLLSFLLTGSIFGFQVKGAKDGTQTESGKKDKELSQIKYTAEQEYLFNIFQNRRSVRKFKPDPMPDEHLLKILEIAITAPTSGNQQPWKFLVIKDRNKINKLKEEVSDYYTEKQKQGGETEVEKLKSSRERRYQSYSNYLSAPVFIIVLVDKNSKYPSYNIYDGTLAAGYLMIAARALGYGTVFTTDSFPFEVVKKVFEIPDNFEQICCTPIGIPETWPKPPNKKKLDEFLAFEKLIAGVNYKEPVKRTAIQLDPVLIAKYTGKYVMDNGTEITITSEKNQVFIQLSGQPKFEIFSEAENKFFLKVIDAQVIFNSDQNGRITEIIIDPDGQAIKAKKIN